MLTTLKCLLLKDSAESNRQLTSFIEKTGTLTLESTAANTKEAVHLINTTAPDIVFLPIRHYTHVKNDISDKEKLPVFICTSTEEETSNTNLAYTHLTLNGSPLLYTLFLNAVNRAILQIMVERPGNVQKDGKFFFIKSEYRILKVNYDDIIFCEGLKDYTQVYTTKKTKPIITLQNLKTFSERLPSKNFVRIHRSYIVSLNHIESITKKEVEIAEKILPIGNSYRNNLLDIVRRNS